MSPLNAAICTTTYLERQNVMVQTRKYYLKNQYLTLKSKVKVTGRSLWYVTHRLMVMRPHTKYHWPISKETIIWPWGQRSRSNKGHYSMWHTALWTCIHIPNIIYPSRKKQLGHYGTWHTALWSYTHIPNNIDLSQYKNVMVQTRKYYLKNHYLTLRSKVKVPGRSLWYTALWSCTHTKYHWPISKETIIWP